LGSLHFTDPCTRQRYNKLKKEFTANYLDKLTASTGDGEGLPAAQPAVKTGGKRKSSAASGGVAAQDKEKNTKKARKPRAEKALPAADDGSDADDAGDYEV
jgi:hypothetical protein